MRRFTWEDVEKLVVNNWPPYSDQIKIWGVPRGGCFIAMILEKKGLAQMVEHSNEADIIVDDLIESGQTRDNYINKDFWAPITKTNDDEWIEFPWEAKEEPVQDNLERLNQYYNFSDEDFNAIKGIISKYEN